jgi:signal transduction histidine kinase
MSLVSNGATGDWARRDEPIRRLLYVVQQLSLARSLEAIQQIVRHAARALTGADGATFVLREDDLCHYADEEAIAPLWKGQRFPMETCISGWAMLHRQAVAIPDIGVDSRIPQDAYRPTFVKSLAMVPIRAADPIGAIGVYWATPHRTSHDELELIQALADTVAVAMENVAARAELEQRVRDRTAEMLAAKEEAERANRAKSRFMAAASHDLRQPLQTIGALNALLERSPTTAEQQEIARNIKHALRMIRNILDGLLDIRRFDGDTLHSDLKDFQIGRLLERVAAACEQQAREKGLILRVAPSSATVRSDPALLERIVQNLVTNAIRYTPSGVVLIGCRRAGSGLRIEIRDTGIGIPADEQHAIFREYYRVNSAGPKGKGLGLAIAERIARLLGHRLQVRSAVGRGSTFSLVVPRGHGASQKRMLRHDPAGLRLTGWG